jgi:hypothetical protein
VGGYSVCALTVVGCRDRGQSRITLLLLRYCPVMTSKPLDTLKKGLATLQWHISCYASLSVVRLGRDNVDATVDDSAMVFGH